MAGREWVKRKAAAPVARGDGNDIVLNYKKIWFIYIGRFHIELVGL